MPDLEPLFYVVSVSLLGIAGNQFGNKACKEQLYSNDECHQGQIEQRLVCNRPELEPLGL